MPEENIPPNQANTPAAPSSTPQTTPGEPTSPQPITPTMSTGMDNSSGKKKLRILITALIAILILLGGTAAAYFGLVVPNKPENVLRRAIGNTLTQRQIKVQGTVGMAGSDAANNLDVAVEVQSDSDKKATSFIVTLKVDGMELPIEVRAIGNDLYLKLGGGEQAAEFITGFVQGLLGGGDAETQALVQEIVNRVANKWIKFDGSSLGLDQDCFSQEPLSEEDVKQIVDVYSRQSFAKIKESSSDNVGGRPALRYVLELDSAKATEFNKQVSELPRFKKIKDCSGNLLNSAAEQAESGEPQSQITVWVDKANKTFSKVEIKTNDGTPVLSLNLEYSGVNVEEPKDAVPYNELLQDVLPSLFGDFNGGNLEADFTNNLTYEL